MRSAAGLLIGLFVLLFGAKLVSYTVTEVQQVVVTQFGEKIRVVTEPGLYFKYPDPIQKTTYFDKWLLEYDAAPEQIFTRDKKVLVLDNYARWRIVDPYLFMQSLQTVDRALKRLRDIVKSELLKELGRHELSEVVALNRESIMELVTARCDSTARAFGIEILEDGNPLIHARTPIRFEVLVHRFERDFDRAVGIARRTGDHSAIEGGEIFARDFGDAAAEIFIHEDGAGDVRRALPDQGGVEGARFVLAPCLFIHHRQVE